MKARYIFLALLSLATLTESCRKDFAEEASGGFFVTDGKTLTFKQDGGTKELLITAASGKWEIVQGSYEKWITPVKDGDKLRVTVQPNDDSKERSGSITIATPQGKRTFTLTQTGIVPTLSIEGDISEIMFKREAESRDLHIISNSTDWRVESLGADAPWLTWKKSDDSNTLILSVKNFAREEENATTNRRTTIFVSNGSEHVKLNVVQRGWAQFGEPSFPRSLLESQRLTRDEIIAHERSLGHERQMWCEEKIYPYDQSGADKKYLAFSTDGEQASLILYQFEDGDNGESFTKFTNKVYFLAKKQDQPGTSFNKDDLEAWMKLNNYTAARPLVFESWHGPNERYERYYMEDDKAFHLYKVYNDASAWVGGVNFRSAFMEYQQTSNYILVGKPYPGAEEQLLSFPTRDLTQLHKAKLNDVIAYEAKHGMIPDYESNLTVKGTYPGVEYSSLFFKQKVPDSSKKGNLIYVLYRFNAPNAMDGDENNQRPSEILSLDPDLAGTVGSRRDVYQGKDLAYHIRKNTIHGMDEYILHTTFRNRAEEKCFDYVNSSTSGFTTFVRGEELLVDINPINEWLTMEFYRSKELVKLIKTPKSN